jgi:hypothetical protein
VRSAVLALLAVMLLPSSAAAGHGFTISPGHAHLF